MAHTTQSIRQLSADEALAALGRLRARQPVKYAAFYSSQLGGIVTDPALMVIPFDDHMVHRGHGIFDTAGLVAGRSTISRRTSIASSVGRALQLRCHARASGVRDIIVRRSPPAASATAPSAIGCRPGPAAST